jgi:hypothetical protein
MAAVAIVAITGLYGGFVVAVGMPAPAVSSGTPWNPGSLMLMTETLTRRASALRRRGDDALVAAVPLPPASSERISCFFTPPELQRVGWWIDLHEAVVVASGFIGRYIYTAVPRSADGVVIEAQELQVQLTRAREEAARRPLDATPALPATPKEREAKTPAGRWSDNWRRTWARRLLATWHDPHPAGMVLFVAAFVHVGAVCTTPRCCAGEGGDMTVPWAA